MIQSCLPEDLVGIETTLSSELESVNDWLISNKLLLHLGKCSPLCLERRENYANVTLLILYVMEMSTVTYLGVTLDH